MALIRCGAGNELGNFALKQNSGSNTISDCVIGKDYLIAKAGGVSQTLSVTGGTYNELATMVVGGTSEVYYGVITATATTITLSGVGSATSTLIVFEIN